MKEAQKWMAQAKADFSTAKANLQVKKYYASVQFSQQAIEKALKALWMVEKGDEYPLIHDLYRLGKQLSLPEKFFEALKELTSAYSESRYPDSTEIIPAKKFSKADALKYIDCAKEILKWIKERM